MPRCDGVEATRRIRAEHPGTQVVVLTTYADDESLFPALRAGARGYLTKDAGGDEIVRAVESVLSGDAGLSPSIQRRLLERLSEPAPSAVAPVEPPDGLTTRETEVLLLIAEDSPIRRSPADCMSPRHREDPHQQPLRQDGPQGPCSGGALRLWERSRTATDAMSHLMG